MWVRYFLFCLRGRGSSPSRRVVVSSTWPHASLCSWFPMAKVSCPLAPSPTVGRGTSVLPGSPEGRGQQCAPCLHLLSPRLCCFYAGQTSRRTRATRGPGGQPPSCLWSWKAVGGGKVRGPQQSVCNPSLVPSVFSLAPVPGTPCPET